MHVYIVHVHTHTPLTSQAEENMRRYGKRLMSSFPDKTTQLLTSLCTDWIPIGHTKITCEQASLHCVATSCVLILSIVFLIWLLLPVTHYHT